MRFLILKQDDFYLNRMSIRKDNKNFHTTYDDKTLENMKRYYGINTDGDLVKYIKKTSVQSLMKETISYPKDK